MVPRGCGVRRWQNVKQNLPLYWGSPWKVLKSCWLHTPFELKISPYFNGVFPFFWQTWRFTTGVVCSLQFAVCDGHGFRIKHLPSYSILDSRDPKEISPQGLIWLLGFPIFFCWDFPQYYPPGNYVGNHRRFSRHQGWRTPPCDGIMMPLFKGKKQNIQNMGFPGVSHIFDCGLVKDSRILGEDLRLAPPQN